MARQHRAAVHEHRRHVEPHHPHHRAGQRLVAAAETDQRVVAVRAHRHFDAVGNQFARQQAHSHAVVIHRGPVRNRDGGHDDRHAAAFGDCEQGVLSPAELMMATSDLSMSSSSKPVARKKARCAARDGPSVTILERCLCSIFILVLQPAGAEVWTVPRSAPLAARPRGYKYRLDKDSFFAPSHPELRAPLTAYTGSAYLFGKVAATSK